jgi:hypothetical protein
MAKAEASFYSAAKDLWWIGRTGPDRRGRGTGWYRATDPSLIL